MTKTVGFTNLKDRRIKRIAYVEVYYITEDDTPTLLRYEPKSAGVEENILDVSDDGSGYKRLDIKLHFKDAELKVLEMDK